VRAVFPRNVRAAVAVQRALAPLVVAGPRPRRLERIAGVDVAYEPRRGTCIGAVTVLSYPALAVEEEIVGEGKTPFPYVPGLLSFREAPLLYRMLKERRERFDVLIVDGQGVAHPRRFGFASHLGVLLDVPTIGCAKSRLCGDVDGVVGEARGSRAALRMGRERVGTVLRTRTGVKPIYVSVGHRAALRWATALVLELTPRYRIPEPIRCAHRAVTRAAGGR